VPEIFHRVTSLEHRVKQVPYQDQVSRVEEQPGNWTGIPTASLLAIIVSSRLETVTAILAIRLATGIAIHTSRLASQAASLVGHSPRSSQ
jgi:hypothetical protein